MTPATGMTDEELAAEYSAAMYFADASDDRETIQRAEARATEIEAEWDRRDAVGKSAAPTNEETK